MSVYDIGRVCVKTMGREAARHCVIVDVIDKNYLLIDGLTIKRRRVNYKHIIPIDEVVNIKKGASHDKVVAAIEDAGLEDLLNKTIEVPIR
ncbi:MAG: 50S ribosomal protein L14e|nr:50S ribosomal protein L14e [Candidatus Lokiarchaeota archaeon]MBD3202048.1 50S ribosomal protein L14e [Candidatus Lokiarchaeota archaeon]